MNSRPCQRVVIFVLVFTLLGGLAGEAQPPIRASAQGIPPINAAIAFFNGITLTNKRSRVYGEARRTQAEVNAYYDGLIATAREQLRQRQLAGANRSQLAAYIKMVARLERERAAATQLIEAEKKQAFHEFQRNFGQRVLGPLISAPGAQSILGELRTTIREVSDLTQAIRTALGNGNPIDALVDQYTSKLDRIPNLQATVRQLGYAVGDELDRHLGGLAAQVQALTQDPRTGLEEVTNATTRLDNLLYDFEQRTYDPAPAVNPDSLAGQIMNMVGPNRSIDVAAEAYANLLQIRNAISGDQKGTMRERIRQQLLEQNIDRLEQLLPESRYVVCDNVDRAEYVEAAQTLGKQPEQPREGEAAAYLVCIERSTGLPILASLIGGGSQSAAEATEIAESPSEAESAPSPTAASAENKAQATATQSPGDQAAGLVGQCDAMDYITVSNGKMVGNESVGYAYQVEITNSHPELNITLVNHLSSGELRYTPFPPGTLGHPYCITGQNVSWSTDWIAAYFRTPECVAFFKSNTIDRNIGLQVVDVNYPACP